MTIGARVRRPDPGGAGSTPSDSVPLVLVATRKVAGLSPPALGATRLRSRAWEATIQLVAELYASNPEFGKAAPTPDGGVRNAGADAGTSHMLGPSPYRLVGR